MTDADLHAAPTLRAMAAAVKKEARLMFGRNREAIRINEGTPGTTPVFCVSAFLAWTRRKWDLWPRLLAVFPCMHFAWALGFFRRLVEWPRHGNYWP